ncbi:MAG TPA: NrfD/PsrC family molybdoenzyme membrane anchor subunit, partial [Gemmatimonadaceae bacterium]|nr:NrfD/PsrC family molybdoenzyme membrane anchor subunit [Gemmatimonadaceae bacterium]
LALSLLYAYFTLSEYLTTWYGGAETDVRLLDRLTGSTAFGTAFWLWAAFGLFVPIGMLLVPSRRSLHSIVTASVLVNVGMWLKRYLIVVPTLETPFLPASSAGVTPHYFPSLVECTITAGAFAAFMLLFTLFSRLFPILSIWETAEDAAEDSSREELPEGAHHRPALAAFGIAFLAGTLALLVPRGVADAQAAATNAVSTPASANAQIALARSTEDGQDMLVGTVTSNGRPLAGVTVAFSVARTFGNMTLGSDQTLSDGSAAVPFPKGLPGDSSGRLRVLATVQSPSELAGRNATVTMPGGIPTHVTKESQPRALWSARPPLPMIATIFGLLLCVWSTYAFVVGQLIAMSHVKQEG